MNIFEKQIHGAFAAMDAKNKRGGARAGAGRKPGRGEAKRNRNVSLSPIVWEFLASLEDSANNQIEDTIRRSGAFKTWLKSQEST